MVWAVFIQKNLWGIDVCFVIRLIRRLDMDFDWKATVATVAPAVAGLFGTPLAGLAVKAGLAAFGISASDIPTDQASAEKMLAGKVASATPADLLNLKESNNKFEEEMKSLGVDLKKIAAGDRADARQREISTGDNAPKILATVTVTGFFTTLYVIAFVSIPESAQQPVNILLGALTALLIQVGNYYFGSSAGSAKKNQTIHAALNR